MNFDLLREIVKDLVGGVDLGVVVQMGVDVAGCSDVAVTEPFLNVLEGYAVGVQKCSAGMTKVVETYVPHPMLFQKYRKRLRKICRFDPFAHGVYVFSLFLRLICGET